MFRATEDVYEVFGCTPGAVVGVVNLNQERMSEGCESGLVLRILRCRRVNSYCAEACPKTEFCLDQTVVVLA